MYGVTWSVKGKSIAHTGYDFQNREDAGNAANLGPYHSQRVYGANVSWLSSKFSPDQDTHLISSLDGQAVDATIEIEGGDSEEMVGYRTWGEMKQRPFKHLTHNGTLFECDDVHLKTPIHYENVPNDQAKFASDVAEMVHFHVVNIRETLRQDIGFNGYTFAEKTNNGSTND